jgi:formylglycine-generating enzyme required for sulfatase activity
VPRWTLLCAATLLLAGTAATAQVPVPDPVTDLALLAPGSVFRDCADCPEMVVIPAGEFAMGSLAAVGSANEHPQHPVTIAQRFALARFPVTRAEFAQFVRATKSRARDWMDPGFEQTERDPVVEIDWLDAQAYVYWLSQRTHQTYRLPSEAEWEYAARAGVTTEFWWGGDTRMAPAYANFEGITDGFANTAPVGTYPANRFGLFDMAGNVWQWTADCYNRDYHGAPTDGAPWQVGDCNNRVVRGGSWYDPKTALRVTNRTANLVHDHDANVGFRVARALTP